MTEFSGGDDPILRELLPGYLARREEELKMLDEALKNKDFSTLRTIGHNLFGSGGAYGLIRVSELGRQLEVAAQQADSEEIQSTIQQMREFLSNLSI
ncbi:MAG: Hpt domain-containing protein [Gammaproteobacteria bacterium]|nr:Hpt domain-containing protein [Gammaproteobacteria bacterium]